MPWLAGGDLRLPNPSCLEPPVHRQQGVEGNMWFCRVLGLLIMIIANCQFTPEQQNIELKPTIVS